MSIEYCQRDALESIIAQAEIFHQDDLVSILNNEDCALIATFRNLCLTVKRTYLAEESHRV